jgi:hypothetical protein
MGEFAIRPGRAHGAPSRKSLAQLLMERETRFVFGQAPRSLNGSPLEPMSWQILGDSFLLRGVGEHYFHYKVGRGVTIDRGSGVDPREEALWMNGSVYSAIASLNGLLPIHASAVAVGQAVVAFTGPAGAGKSTLVAALANRGIAMFCDDTLVLDLSDDSRIVCLPGHKRLKLRPEAVQLTGALAMEKVSAAIDKFYAEPGAGTVREPLPLVSLVFLEEGPEAEITAIRGAERLVRLHDDHQTSRLFAQARSFDRAERFKHLDRLAKQMRMDRFVRPRDSKKFHQGVDLVEQYISDLCI